MFKSLRASTICLAAVGVVAALLIAAQSHWGLNKLDRYANEAFVAKDVVADILPPPMYLIELRLILSEAVEGSITPAQAQQEADKKISEYEQRVTYWTKNPPFGLEKQLLGRQHQGALKFIAAARSDVLAPLAKGDTATAAKNLAAVHTLYLEHRAGVDETTGAGTKMADRTISSFNETRDEIARYAYWVLGIGLLLVIAVWRPVLRSLRVPINKCSELAKQVASGNLMIAIDRNRADEIGTLQEALGGMQSALRSMVGAVRDSTDSIKTASSEVASGGIDLSKRTEDTSSHLQQAAAAMEELTATMHHNADSARKANTLATSATDIAERGGHIVSQVVSTMEGIDTSSRKIVDIIAVIDGIAFQTNILALNAAVEAARAGEQGRGFAVVASEVRLLAQRSAEAAKEIKALIDASVTRVQSGSKLVQEAGGTMDEIVKSVRNVTTIIAEITGAASEQSAGIAQVNDAVARLDQMTQENAALVEESSAAAANLSSQAVRLADVVRQFQLEDASPRLLALR